MSALKTAPTRGRNGWLMVRSLKVSRENTRCGARNAHCLNRPRPTEPLPRLKAVVVVLPRDAPAVQFEEHGEVGLHLGSGGERAHGNRQRSRPPRLHRHAIAS